MKKKKEFSIMDQVSLDQENQTPKKDLQDQQETQDFTEQEINDFREYNEKVTELDPTYSSLKPRNRKVLLRMFTKEFRDNDDVLATSKVDFIPVRSGVNDSIVHMEVPNPYPFTSKAVVVASQMEEPKAGDIVYLLSKPQIGIQSQDQGVVTVNGGFVHPDYQEEYDEYPQDPKDPNYGYVLLDETIIQFIK